MKIYAILSKTGIFCIFSSFPQIFSVEFAHSIDPYASWAIFIQNFNAKKGRSRAHHKSAKKRIKQTVKKTERNRYYRTRMKNIVRAVREAAEAGDKEKALEAFKVANKQLHHYVSKGFLKKQTASRKVSRLHKLVNSIEAA